MSNLYAVPPGVTLGEPEVHAALAAIGIEHRKYIANGMVHHAFSDRVHDRSRSLFLVESRETKQLAEVAGDTTLWLLVRKTACRVCAAPALADSENVEQTA